MEGFTGKLEVGMQAMIINTHYPENTHNIGKIVTIEALLSAGQPASVFKEWLKPGTMTLLETLTVDLAIITGLGDTPYHIAGHASIQQRFLMPLPPLDDDVLDLDVAKPKETEKC